MTELIIGGLLSVIIILVIVFPVMVIRAGRSKIAVDQEALESRFKNIATEVLDNNTAKFKESATDPMKTLMSDLKGDIQKLQDQSTEHTTLAKDLRDHTDQLANVLSNTKNRGDFGEMLIEKWFESAGLKKGIHYDAQIDLPGVGKPDFIMYMPDNKCIILDSKTPLDSLQGAFDAGIDRKQQENLFKKHRDAVKRHITELSNREYPTQMVPGPDNRQYHPVEYVVMVVPEYALLPVMDTDMIDFAQKRNVVLATSSTSAIIANLIHMLWKHRDISQNVRQVISKASALQHSIEDFSGSYLSIGKSINTLGTRYDNTKKILNDRIIPSVADLGIASSIADDELSENEGEDMTHDNSNAEIQADSFQSTSEDQDNTEREDPETPQSLDDNEISDERKSD